MPSFIRLTRHGPVLAGIVVLALSLGALAALPAAWREDLRELAFDMVLAADQRLRKRTASAPVIVVEIEGDRVIKP